MVRKITLLVLCVCVSGLIHAQSEIYTPYEFPASIPDKYRVDAPGYYKELERQPVSGYKSRENKAYAEMIAYGKFYLLNRGEVYFGWNEIEDYLNEILEFITPDSLKSENLHVYLRRNAQYNAITIPDGSIFIHVGYLADLYNEASLAVALGHELAHYINKDTKNGYYRNIKLISGKSNRSHKNIALDIAHNSQDMEHTADSLSYLFAYNAGYDIRYGNSNFNLFLLEQSLNEDVSFDDDPGEDRTLSNVGVEDDESDEPLDDLLSSHPKLQDRMKRLEEYAGKMKDLNKKAKMIIATEEKFNKIQELAKMESLEVLLESNDYFTCAERAFVNYLLDPGNDTYIYYLLESLRRVLYIKPEMKKHGFLTDYYTDYFDKGEGILTNLEFMVRDTLKYQAIKVKNLLNTEKPVFQTYQEAFNYFGKIAEIRKIKECQLTLALAYHNVKEKRDPFLKEYIKMGGKYSEYAEALLNDGLEKKLKKNRKEYLILADMEFIEYHFYGSHNRLLLAEEVSPGYVEALEKMMAKHYPNKEFVSVRQASDRNFRQLMELTKVGIAFDFYKYFLQEEEAAEAEREWEEGVQEAYYFEDEDDDEDDEDENEETFYFDDDGEEVEVDLVVTDVPIDTVKEQVVTIKVEAELEVDLEEEPERGPLNAFVLNPFCWQYFYENKLRSLELLKVVSHDDQTEIAIAAIAMLRYLYPPYWYELFTKTESNRYQYELYHLVYGINEDDIEYQQKVVSYKMRKEHLINSTYHLLKEDK